LGLSFLAFFFGWAPGVATVAPSSVLDEFVEEAAGLSGDAAGAAESAGAAADAGVAGSADVAGVVEVAGAVPVAGGSEGVEAG